MTSFNSVAAVDLMTQYIKDLQLAAFSPVSEMAAEAEGYLVPDDGNTRYQSALRVAIPPI